MWEEQTKKPIVKFLILVFAMTWSLEGIALIIEKAGCFSAGLTKVFVMCLVALAALTPGISIFILLKQAKLIKGLKDYFNRVFKWRSPTAFIVTLISVFTVFFVIICTTEEPSETLPMWTAPVVLIMMIPGGGWEELGWRGFLQPALEEKLGFVPGTLVMGCIWSVWHLPLWLLQSTTQKLFLFWAFAIYCICLSFLLAITYKASKSVFAAILVHAWGNTICGGVYSFHILERGPVPLFYILYAVAIAGSIVAYYLIDKKEGSPIKDSPRN